MNRLHHLATFLSASSEQIVSPAHIRAQWKARAATAAEAAYVIEAFVKKP